MVKKTRWISVVLIMILLLTTFVACSKPSNQDSLEEPDKSDETGNNDEEEAPEENGPSWSWNTDTVTIDWYVNYDWAGYTWDAENRMMDKLLTEKTGVTLNVITPASGGDEKLNAMMAGDTLPDVITLDWRAPQIKLMAQGDLLYSINELMDEYAPTMKAIIPQSMIDAHKYPDGNFYGIPSYFWAPEQMDPERNYWETNAGMLVRKDIMDDLGITRQDFSTQEGTISALKKVKDESVKYNGVDVAPIYFGAGAMDALDLSLPAFFAVPMEDEQGSYIDLRTHPKFLEAVKFTNRLYREGLLPKENFTSQRQQIEEKITSGNVFAFLGNVGDYNGSMSALYELDPTAQFVTVDPIRASDGGDPVRIESGMGWTLSCVTKKSENPDRVIRFMEFLYSEEGDLLMNYGIEGETYIKNDDGTIEFTEEQKKLQLEDSDKYTAEYGFGGFGWLINYVKVQMRTKAKDEISIIKEGWYRDMSKMVYPTTLFEKLGPEPGSEASNSLQQIDEFWYKNIANIMVADSEEECVQLYNDTIGQMNKMGLQDIVKGRNDNFQANKQSFGVKYAWPAYGN